MGIAFGTEGWRAIIAEEFTVENVCNVSQAIAEHMLANQSGRKPLTLAVGYDTRFLSGHFANAVCEVLAANGIHTLLADRAVPTCAVSRAVVAHRLAAGIMVTASHNPAPYNGVKVKESFGGSATPETVASIERRVGVHPVKRLRTEDAQRFVRRTDFLPDFLDGIQAVVDLAAIRRSRFKVLVDPMHGTGGRLVEQMIMKNKRSTCRVETLHADPDPLFGGHAPEPIAKHLQELGQTLRRRRWDVGLATDGDADRIGVMAPTGVFVNPGQVLCILLDHLISSRRWQGAVVKTVSNTSMITRMCHALGLRLLEVPVGFKHIAKLMLEDQVVIGGEESGGIGVQGYLPERDGILNGLLVLEAMAAQGHGILQILKRLERRFGRWHYARRDLTVLPEQVTRLFERLASDPPAQIAGSSVIEVKRLDGVKLIGRDESWVLFRRSGTEPIVRVYAESLQAKHVNQLLEFGVKLAQTA